MSVLECGLQCSSSNGENLLKTNLMLCSAVRSRARSWSCHSLVPLCPQFSQAPYPRLHSRTPPPPALSRLFLLFALLLPIAWTHRLKHPHTCTCTRRGRWGWGRGSGGGARICSRRGDRSTVLLTESTPTPVAGLHGHSSPSACSATWPHASTVCRAPHRPPLLGSSPYSADIPQVNLFQDRPLFRPQAFGRFL